MGRARMKVSVVVRVVSARGCHALCNAVFSKVVLRMRRLARAASLRRGRQALCGGVAMHAGSATAHAKSETCMAAMFWPAHAAY